MIKNKTYDKNHMMKTKTKTILKLTYVLLSATTNNIGHSVRATCFGRTTILRHYIHYFKTQTKMYIYFKYVRSHRL